MPTPEEQLADITTRVRLQSSVFPCAVPVAGLVAADIHALAASLAPTRYSRGTVADEVKQFGIDPFAASPDLTITGIPTQYVYRVHLYLNVGPLGGITGMVFGLYGTGPFDDCVLHGWGTYFNRNTTPYPQNGFQFGTTNFNHTIDTGDGSSEFIVDFEGVLIPYQPGPAPEVATLALHWGHMDSVDPPAIRLRAGSTLTLERLPNAIPAE